MIKIKDEYVLISKNNRLYHSQLTEIGKKFFNEDLLIMIDNVWYMDLILIDEVTHNEVINFLEIGTKKIINNKKSKELEILENRSSWDVK